RLSDLFTEAEGCPETALELIVKIYNINEGHSEAPMEKCPALRGYARFVARVQENLGPAEALRGLSAKERRAALAKAIRQAVRYCTANDILKEFIERNAGEVENMLTAEFDLNIAERVWKEQAWEEGRGIGNEEGKLEILALIEQYVNLEDFKRLQAQLKGTVGDTRTVQA
ncbi:MAG: hypothetical protein LBD08_03495, partial [Treponema sp.]|nr:hypothetical protein [Treponema sp.]